MFQIFKLCTLYHVTITLSKIKFTRMQKLTEILKKIYSFNEKNVMISGTHSHSGPAGFFQFLLFEVTSLGHVDDTTQAFVDGIAKSILQGYFIIVNLSITYTVVLFVFKYYWQYFK